MHAENENEDLREFLRVDHETPLNFKVMSGEKFTARSDVFSRNISACGLLFRTTRDTSIPALSSIVWVELDSRMINVCSEIEEDLILHKNGIFGRVVRIAEGEPGISYDIGVCFLRKSNMAPEEIQAILTD
jgi:hypothetical protein